MTRTVLQISDCHLVAEGASLIGVDTQASLEAVLRQAMSEAIPDAIIASGDIAHDPILDVYARFLGTVRGFSAAPLLCLPGNHDELGVMRAVGLPMHPLELGTWSIVALDSHEDDAPAALITEADREQIALDIAATLSPHLLVSTHHPLVAVNCPWLDKDRIQNPTELVEWLTECSARDGAGRLRSVVFGHAHQSVADRCAGVPVFGAPSTCFQFMPCSDSFATDTLPPGYRWLQLADDGRVTTDVRRVESFPIHVQLDR